MTVRTKRALAMICACAVAGFGVVVWGAWGSGGEAAEGELRLGLGEPESLIPPDIDETEGGEIADHVYTGLYEYNVDGSLRPMLAAAEPQSLDNTTWTIEMEDGFSFQNGEEITAETFVQSWNYAVYGPNGNAGAQFFNKIAGFDETQSQGTHGRPHAEELSGLEAVDDNTLQVTLSAPFGGFPTMLGHTAFYPMAEECLDDIPACNERPIGNGMYLFDGEWEHDQSINLRKWDDYAGDQPQVEAVSYQIYTAADTCWQDFEAGNVDICSPSAADYASAKEKYGAELLEERTSDTWSLGFPVYDERFAEVDVRRAFSMAIDRGSFIDGQFQGRYQEGHSYVPGVIPGYLSNSCHTACEFDAAAARDLLNETGFDTSQPVQLWVNSGPGERYLKALGDQLAQHLGIEYELNTLGWPVFLEKKQSRELTGPFLTGWVADYPLNENYLAPLFANGPSNDFGYHDARFERLLAQGDGADSLDRAVGTYQEAEERLIRGLPAAPIWKTTTATVLGDRVSRQSYEYNPILGHYDYAKIALR